MSLLKDFNELDISVRTFTIGVAVLMPFWYLAIFFFGPEFMARVALEIPIIISFCLSIFFLFCNCFIAFIHTLIEHINEKSAISQTKVLVFFTLLKSILHFVAFAYLWNLFQWEYTVKNGMFWFTNVVFTFVFIRMGWAVLRIFILKWKMARKVKNKFK